MLYKINKLEKILLSQFIDLINCKNNLIYRIAKKNTINGLKLSKYLCIKKLKPINYNLHTVMDKP